MKRERNNTNNMKKNMNREKREKHTYIYILNIYIRNSSQRDYQSRRQNEVRTRRTDEERKKKVGHNERIEREK